MAFVVASHYRLQTIFLLSQACLQGSSLLVKYDRRFCKDCLQQGLIVIGLQCSISICFKFLTAGWYIVTKANVRDLLAFMYVYGPIV